MGMFDWIEYECDCPFCGKRISGFQSKDAECLLDILQPTEVTYMYTSCGHCDSWVEYEVIPKLSGFDLKLNETHPWNTETT